MADNQGTQTVTVPGVGDIDFPDHMSPDEMSQAIQKNFPHLGEMAKTAQANRGRALASAVGQAAFGNQPPPQAPGLFGATRQPVVPQLDPLKSFQQRLDAGTPAPQLARRAHVQKAQALDAQYHASPSAEEAPATSLFDMGANALVNPAAQLYERTLQDKPLAPLALDYMGNQVGVSGLGTRVIPSALETNYGKAGTLEAGDSNAVKRVKGVGRGLYGTLGGATTPENLAAMTAFMVAPESAVGDVATAAFSGQMGGAAVEEGLKARESDDPSDFWEHMTRAVGNAAFAGAPVLEGIRDHAANRMADKLQSSVDAQGAIHPEAPIVPTESPVGTPTAERRSVNRKRVADMTPDELRIDALTSAKTGLNNRRAFDELQEDKPANAVGFSDVDGLKALNDKYGYAAGDALLKAKADALREAGIDAYHDKGDEFLHRGDDPKALAQKLDNAREILRNKEIEFPGTEGGPVKIKGADFSYGVGGDLGAAEGSMHTMKNAREAAGERSRGSMGKIQEVKAEPQGVVPAEQSPVIPATQGTENRQDVQQGAQLQAAPAESTQALNPSEGIKPGVISPEPPKVTADKYEGPIRKLVGSWIRTKQLQGAARDRYNVELALQALGKDNTGTLGDKKLAPAGLGKERLGMVESVAKTLGTTPKDLWERNYRLSDDEVKQLQGQLKQGIKTMPLKTLAPDHPETKFAENAPYPLADINQANAQMAGVRGAKDLWRSATDAEQAKHKEYVQAGKRDISAGEATGEGLTIKGRRKAEAEGSVRSGGKDALTLQFEHDAMQGVLDRHAKDVAKKLQELIPDWRQARIDTPEASQLAKDINELSRSSKAGIPKELYAKEHLEPKAGQAAEATPVQEPIPSSEAAPKEQPTASTTPAPKSKGSSESIIKAIEQTHEELRTTHGADIVNPALEQMFQATRAKYSDAGTTFKVYQKAVEKYKDLMAKGDSDPVKNAIAQTIDRFPAEGGQSTLHANPIGAIWDKIFGFKKPVTQPFNPTIKLPESALADFTTDLGTLPKPSMREEFAAYSANELSKIKQTVEDAPAFGKSLLDKVTDVSKAAWDYWKNRPGLSPLQWALGGRSLKLQADAIVMHRFVNEIQKLHPDVSRREAMVNYLQAGGGVRPDRDVNAELQLKGNSFSNRMDNKRLQKGYFDAQNLTQAEKDTVAKYRTYEADMRQKEEAQGLELHARENYIRQVWDTDSFTRKKVDAFFHAGSFTTSGAFMKERKFEDYFEGEMSGLKPKRKDFGYLVTARARASAEVLANRALVESLYQERMPDGGKLAEVNGVGVPQGTVINPDGSQTKGAILIKQAKPQAAIATDGRPYVSVNQPAFQNWKWVGEAEGGLNEDGTPAQGTTVLYKGNMLVHPDVAKQLERVLQPSAVRSNPLGKAALQMSSVGKQTLLIGLFHPVQLGIHFTEHAAEGGTTGRTMQALNPFSKSVIDLDHDPVQQQLVVHGLKVADFNGESMWDEGVMSKGFANAAPLLGKWLTALHDGMFQRYIPNLKMSMALDALERNKSRYLDKFTADAMAKSPSLNPSAASMSANSQVLRMTADQMNSAFGGLNWDFLPMNKTQQDIARLTVLAPDFLLARMQFAADSFRPGGMESRKALLVGAFTQYLAARAFNYAMNDGDAKWDVHDWNKFVAGHHSYSLRTVQGDMGDAIMDWRTFTSHRLNPLTLRPAMELATQKDAFGHPASAGQMLYDFAKNFVPMPLQGGMDQAFGKNVGQRDESIADTIIQSLGLQRKKYRSPAEREVFTKFDNLQGNPTNDDLALEQKNTFRALREKFDKGELDDLDIEHALDAGKLKPSQVRYLHRTAKETRLVREARHLEPNEVLDAWDKGTPTEKMELLPVARAKANKLPEDLREKAVTKLETFLDSLSDDKQDKLLEKGQQELDYEYPPAPEEQQ